MRGQVFLGFAIVRFQSSTEEGGEVGMRGGCGGDGGHDGRGQEIQHEAASTSSRRTVAVRHSPGPTLRDQARL